jgi:hypothetical protein
VVVTIAVPVGLTLDAEVPAGLAQPPSTNRTAHSVSDASLR